MIESGVGVLAFLILSFLRLPIAFSMGVVGFVGVGYMVNFSAAASMVAQVAYETGLSYTLSVIPLFVLMGNFVVRAKIAEELFFAAQTFLGHRRGGLAMSTIVASGAFGAICGSAIATTATFTKMAFAPMRNLGYSNALIGGTISSGGTLGILIPPSVVMVIYGILTETNIGRLFIAGILPGILAVVLLCLAVTWTVMRDPGSGPPTERYPWHVRLQAASKIWPVVVLFAAVMGGIYGGVFTATEGAGIGAAGAFLFALTRRALSWAVLRDILVESVRTTAMLFLIMIGAFIFANFINFTALPGALQKAVQLFSNMPFLVLVAICVIYVFLGTFMEELSVISLTVPLFFPVIVSLGYDPIWFGIIVIVVCQIGLVTPPVGIAVFVVKNLAPELSLRDAFWGVLPFTVALILLLAILVVFPDIALVLPRQM
jgi:C4-dicarboxylate transporter, DctM subunit